MHVHIATLGKAREPVMKGLNAIGGTDKVYLITSRNFSDVAEEVSGTCRQLMIDVETMMVDSFDFQDIVDAIYRVYDQEHARDVEFSINITGGTNLMAAAACSCAFFIGATIYYVHWRDGEPMSTQLERIPTPHTPNLSAIKGKTRDILMYILGKGRVSNTQVADAFKEGKQNSGYHLKRLEQEGLISIEKGYRDGDKVDKRRNSITITPQGRLIASWLQDRD